MQRKKILLLGMGQDKTVFLNQLKPVKGQRSVYKVDSQQVDIVTTVEQAFPDHICPKNLDGFDAVIQLFNEEDKNAPGLQMRIPDALPSFIKLLGCDNETSNDYVKKVLEEIKNNKTYHQESSVSAPSIFDQIYSLFGGSRKQEAACPVNHTASQSFRLGVISSN